MRTQQIIHKEIVAVVRSRYRRTGIIEAQYMQALRKAYPEIADFEVKMFTIPVPNLPQGAGGDLTPAQTALLEDYALRIAPVRALYPLGAEYSASANEIVPYLARITMIAGAPFALGADGRFDNNNLVRAFEAALEEDLQPNPGDEDSLWAKLRQAVREVDEPVTGVAERPPEALTEAEKANPLSAPRA